MEAGAPSQGVAEPEMSENRERLFELLMSEKEQADKQIGSYLELQLKLHTVMFTGAAVGAGWAFAKGGGGFASEPEVRATAALTVAVVAIFAVLQAAANYGIVLGYIRYKHQVIGRQLQALLHLTSNPLSALRTIGASRSNSVVMLASVSGGLLFFGGSAGLIAYSGLALRETGGVAGMLGLAVVTCSLFWLVAAGTGLALLKAMAELRHEVSRPEEASATQPPSPDG